MWGRGVCDYWIFHKMFSLLNGTREIKRAIFPLFPSTSVDKAPCVSHLLSLVLRMHSQDLHAPESPRNLLNIHARAPPTRPQPNREFRRQDSSVRHKLSQSSHTWNEWDDHCSWLAPSVGAALSTVSRQRQRRHQPRLLTTIFPSSGHGLVLFCLWFWWVCV